ncbi:nicotinate-nucleotide--dimethylbenzimidazole phosphoribosyltransferase [Cereibacter sphaeroides]|uniref:nicotinate-nucleotide--dimethylbenzimidazole phosphoribosyltransferase n=1 Tax=Cereibacter sphaeroides TaxID=1063 RepID=UPI0039904C8F
MKAPFTSLAGFRAVFETLPQVDAEAVEAATARNETLTKPKGALGRLEDLAIWYAGWIGDGRPALERPQVAIFAGNHGIAARGVSAFPPEVTVQMVANYRAGGAAVNQLCHVAGASMTVTELELDRPTLDFTVSPAMTEDELMAAFAAGWEAVDDESDLLVVGEMGIGNTTAAAAIAAALFGGTAAEWTGRGSGVAGSALEAKTRVVAEGLERHADALSDPLEVLRCLGGREIAAMAGAIARARVGRTPVILDGFICTSAAAVLHALTPSALDHAIAGHVSAEGAHPAALARIGKEPLLDLGMRLGEGTGAIVAINILRSAVACLSGMATFAEAGVSGG